MANSDTLYREMNFALLYTMVRAASEGKYEVLEQFGYDLQMVHHLGELKLKDFVLLTRAPGCFIDTRTKKADNTALANMLTYTGAKARDRDAIDELIRRGATASMIQALEPSLDYEDHGWRRKLLGVERQAGRPPNVDDETLSQLERAWEQSNDFTGSLAERLLKVCDDTGLGADQIWTALRQLLELRPDDQIDPVLAQLPLRRVA